MTGPGAPPSMTESEVVEAIHGQRLATLAQAVANDPPDASSADRARQALDACARIAAATGDAQRAAAEALGRAGIAATPLPIGSTAQRHEFVFEVARESAAAAVTALAELGYLPEQQLTAGAARSRLVHAHELVVRHTGRWTTVARLRWRVRPAPSALRRLVVPTPADWAMVSLPEWAWWGYSLVRPVRLALERLGRRSGHHGHLEPFLATPESLIDPLMDAAAVTADDTVVDIGCGDGRIVVEAAARRHCRAIGVEQSPELAAEARRRAERSGVEGSVEIVQGEGLDLDLTDATVVLMFLPVGIARRVVPELLASMSPGSRVLVHEQGRLPADMPTPHASVPLIGHDAVSVAHRWVVGAPAPPTPSAPSAQ